MESTSIYPAARLSFRLSSKNTTFNSGSSSHAESFSSLVNFLHPFLVSRNPLPAYLQGIQVVLGIVMPLNTSQPIQHSRKEHLAKNTCSTVHPIIYHINVMHPRHPFWLLKVCIAVSLIDYRLLYAVPLIFFFLMNIVHAC